MTLVTFCLSLGFIGLFLLGLSAMIFVLRKRPSGNHDLYQK